MKFNCKGFINYALIILIGISIGFLTINTSTAQHANWHSGESCGRCHCGDFQSCEETYNGGCECENWDTKIEIN
ncbi:hypothetical protein BH23THE1_BH23THE1_22560 [soil metagenome]